MNEEQRKRIEEIIVELQTLLNEESNVLNVVTEESLVTEKRVKRLLRDFGLPANLNGYAYISYAVVYMASKESKISMTNDVYPRIAEAFNDRSSCVERSIRHSIERIFEKGNAEVIRKVFGDVANHNKKGKLTNSEFLFMCLEYLKDEVQN